MRINQYDVELSGNGLPQLVKEKGFNYKTAQSFTNPSLIVDMMNEIYHLNRKAEECVYVIGMDAKCKPLGVFEISKGTVNASLVSPREVMIRLLLCGCVNMIMIHNHPSGSLTPSKEDMQIANQMKKAAELIGLCFADNIIVGDGYLSFNENEML